MLTGNALKHPVNKYGTRYGKLQFPDTVSVTHLVTS